MEFNAQITERMHVNTYAQVSLSTCRNTLDFMCDLELFSEVRLHLVQHVYTMELNCIEILY